jgi:hypothetical protein
MDPIDQKKVKRGILASLYLILFFSEIMACIWFLCKGDFIDACFSMFAVWGLNAAGPSFNRWLDRL